MATYRNRVAEFEQLLDKDVIDIEILRKLCANNGCPHEKSIRSRCWKILLNYLPLQRKEWKAHLHKQRQVYKQFVDEMIVKPGSKQYDGYRTDVTLEDHPLNPNPDSQWSQYFKDNEMLVQIDKDCRRLCPDLAFFQSATNFPLVSQGARVDNLRKRVEQSVLKSQEVSKNWQGISRADTKRVRKTQYEDYVTLPEGQEAHWEVAERILFIYAKLNPGQGYVQGMNEILGPIYYTMVSDLDPETQEHGEADAFWCFTNLMSEIRDNFIKHLDFTECGIGNLMNRLMSLLEEKDMTLWLRLKDQDLKPQFYAFRWITLLLSQEFPLPDVIRLWDSLLTKSSRIDFVINVCCAMLILIRDDLLTGDFPSNMKQIQNYPSTDMKIILDKAAHVSGRS